MLSDESWFLIQKIEQVPDREDEDYFLSGLKLRNEASFEEFRDGSGEENEFCLVRDRIVINRKTNSFFDHLIQVNLKDVATGRS